MEIGDYIRYTDDCFSCHIKFDKPMHGEHSHCHACRTKMLYSKYEPEGEEV